MARTKTSKPKGKASRKLTLNKETLKDLAPRSGRRQAVKGGRFSEICYGMTG